MKNKKLIVSLLTIVALVFMMSANVFAAGPGSITIDDTANTSVSIVGNTYTAFKLFDVTYNADKTSYVYKMDTDFVSFFSGEGADTDEEAYDHVTSAVAADPVAFTAAVLTYLTANPLITAEGAATATTETVTITDIPLGYYLVSGTATAPDSQTITSLCILNTTNPSVTVSPKADAPTMDLQVYEDTNPSTVWGEVADYTVGQDVPFKITTTVPDMNGYADYTYIIHDTLATGFTLNDDITVTIGGVTLVEGTDYVVVTNGQSFTVEILTILDQTPNAVIVVNFTAELNDTAAIFSGDNANTAYLEYSNNPYDLTKTANTPTDEVLVDTYKLDIIKYTGTLTSPTYLANAHFELKNTNDIGAASVQFVQEAGTYRVATPAEIGDGAVVKVTDLVSTATGLIPVAGIDEGTYYLFETIAPVGYNKLATSETITITRVFDAATYADANAVTSSLTNGVVDGDVMVLNNAGLQLPTTGGMGTTIFTVVGIILMAAAVTVLVARKRMQHNNK